jgi:hypothetical protein
VFNNQNTNPNPIYSQTTRLFLKSARNVDESANFVFVQLIEQEPGIYGNHHPDYTRQDKIDLA